MTDDGDPSAGLVGARTRLEELAGDDDLLAYAPTSETDEGVYFVAIRAWPHPDVDGATTVSVRYAYLTKGDGSDGWTDSGMNLRVEGDPEEFLLGLGQLFAAARLRVDGDELPEGKDLRPQPDREG